MDTLPNRSKAFSYLRFSTPDQMRGDSFRRQSEAARRYADAHGLDLDTDLTFRDLGVSAFRGQNATDGALAAFLQAVDAGRVPPGSFLIVENLDRLSRDKIMAALNRFSALLEKSVNVVTLSDGKTYTADSLNNLPDLMLSLLVMSRAHEESKLKGERVRAAWQNKRKKAENGDHVLTAKAPAWLRLEDGSFKVVEERAAIVRRIFLLTIQGWGKSAIARQLNTEKVAPFGSANGWHASYVQKILRNEAVIGRFQPMRLSYDTGSKQRVSVGEPIEGYFPAIVSESDFYKVKHSKPGPSGKGAILPRNVLSGIVYCGLCDGRMHYVNKGNGYTYLACDNARRKKTCTAKSVQYQPVLNYVLDNLSEYRDMYELAVSNQQDTDSELDSISAEIAKTEDSIARLLDTLERVPSASVERRLAEHETRLVAFRSKKAELEEKRAIRQAGSESQDAYVEWYNQPIEPDQIGGAMYSAIAHLSAEIKRTVEKIIVEKDKPIRVAPKSSR